MCNVPLDEKWVIWGTLLNTSQSVGQY